MGAHKCGCAFFMRETIGRAYSIDDVSPEAKELFEKYCRSGLNHVKRGRVYEKRGRVY